MELEEGSRGEAASCVDVVFQGFLSDLGGGRGFFLLVVTAGGDAFGSSGADSAGRSSCSWVLGMGAVAACMLNGTRGGGGLLLGGPTSLGQGRVGIGGMALVGGEALLVVPGASSTGGVGSGTFLGSASSSSDSGFMFVVGVVQDTMGSCGGNGGTSNDVSGGASTGASYGAQLYALYSS